MSVLSNTLNYEYTNGTGYLLPLTAYLRKRREGTPSVKPPCEVSKGVFPCDLVLDQWVRQPVELLRRGLNEKRNKGQRENGHGVRIRHLCVTMYFINI